MGNCAPKNEVDPHAASSNKNINKALKQDKKQLEQEIRVLLLGAGESGKSTIFKQMKIMHGDGFPESECITFRPVIIENVLRNMKSLVMASEMLQIQIREEANKEMAQNVKEMGSEVFLDPTKIWHEKLAEQLEQLWLDEGIQKTYEHRSQLNINSKTVPHTISVI